MSESVVHAASSPTDLASLADRQTDRLQLLKLWLLRSVTKSNI